MLRTLSFLMAAVLPFIMLSAGCDDDDDDFPTLEPNEREARLQAAQTWMYQLSGLDDPAAVAELAATNYPLLVIEPGYNFRPCSDDFDPEDYGIDDEHYDSACADIYPIEDILEELRWAPDGSERLLIAYIDIGQAEWYRDYWARGWEVPDVDSRGNPSFILSADPDDWLGNYVVAFWEDDWKDIWLGWRRGIVHELARLGFDGVYLDWVEAYDDDTVWDAADEEDLDAAEEMVLFVEEIRDAGREVTPDFLVIAQNATFLIDDFDEERYTTAIDALAVEDTWYYGNGVTEDWDAGDGDDGPYDISDRLQCEIDNCSVEIIAPDNVCPDEDSTSICYEEFPVSGDLHGGARHDCPPGSEGTSGCWSTENRLVAYERYQALGVPIFTVDYCISAEAADEVYRESRARGFRPLVTRVQLSRNTDTPPWEFE